MTAIGAAPLKAPGLPPVLPGRAVGAAGFTAGVAYANRPGTAGDRMFLPGRK